MKCQNLFSGKNKKNISVSHLLKILPRVLRVKCLSILGNYDLTIQDDPDAVSAGFEAVAPLLPESRVHGLAFTR